MASSDAPRLPAGIRLRTRDDKKRVYQVQVRLKGHPPQSATFDRLHDAKRWKSQIETDIREGRHFKVPEAKKHTVSDLIDRYIANVLPQKRSDPALQAQQLEWWRREVCSTQLSDLTSALIVACRDRLASGLTPSGSKRSRATVNRYLAVLFQALTYVVKEWEWLEDSPMRKVTKLKEPRGQTCLVKKYHCKSVYYKIDYSIRLGSPAQMAAFDPLGRCPPGVFGCSPG